MTRFRSTAAALATILSDGMAIPHALSRHLGPGPSPGQAARQPRADIAAYYGRYARAGTIPQETGHGTQSLRTVIELAAPDAVKQRIVVAPSFTGLGRTTSWNEDYNDRCVTAHIVSRGPAHRH